MSEPAGSNEVASELIDAPDRICVAQDSDGFWTCREARIGSQEYIRADLARVPIEAVAVTYGQKLIAEAIEAHFGERVEEYDEDVDDTSNHDAWEAFDTAFVFAHPLPQGEAAEAASLVDAATALTHFAWSAVTADCDESREYLTSLLDNLRAALATHPLEDAGDTDDHARGCQGREYTCTCGYDNRRDALVTSLRAERDAAKLEKNEWSRFHQQALFNESKATDRAEAAESSLAAEKQLHEQTEQLRHEQNRRACNEMDLRLVAEQRVAALEGAGGFLLNRLDEYDPGAGARDFCGHVEPAIERFRAALRPAETGDGRL